MGETEEEVKQILNSVEHVCRKYKLEINIDKTKVMKIGRAGVGVQINLGNEVLEEVTSFKYLGYYFSQDMNNYKPIQERIKLGYASMKTLRNIWKSNKITTQLKLRLFDTIVIPTVLYGAECWVLNVKEQRKLLAFEMYGLRRIFKIQWQDRVTNEEVKERAGLKKTILERVHDAQLRWLGHVERMQERRLPKKTFYGRIAGARPKGRPKTTWLRALKKQNSGIEWQEAERNGEGTDMLEGT